MPKWAYRAVFAAGQVDAALRRTCRRQTACKSFAAVLDCPNTAWRRSAPPCLTGGVLFSARYSAGKSFGRNNQATFGLLFLSAKFPRAVAANGGYDSDFDRMMKIGLGGLRTVGFRAFLFGAPLFLFNIFLFFRRDFYF